MTGTIFAETLRRGWRVMLYWGIGMGLYGLLNAVILMDSEQLRQAMTFIESLPSFLIQGFMGSADLDFMLTPNGYFATQFFSLALLAFSAYAVMAGMAVTANDEEAGILDSFLSLPLPRWAVIVERAAAYMLLMIGAVAITFLLSALGMLAMPNAGYDLGGIAGGMVNLLPGMMFVLLFTVLLGVVFRRRSLALGVVAVVVVASYLMDFIARGAPDSALSVLGNLSYFHYYDGVGVLKTGLDLGNMVLLKLVALLWGVLALWRFQRRDVGL